MRFHGILPSLFRNTTSSRVLATILRYPDREWTGRELARESGCAPTHTLRELERIFDEGLVRVRPVGRANVWGLHAGHALIPELSRIASMESMSRERLFATIRKGLERSPGILRIVLFGSIARGEERPRSDVDLFVLVRTDRDKQSLQAPLERLRQRLWGTFTNPLSPVIYTERQFERGRGRAFLVGVERDGIPLLERKGSNGRHRPRGRGSIPPKGR